MKFSESEIKQEIKDALKKMNITEATEIQEKCIPLIFQGKDIVGQSLTGSGKTAAFVIPLAERNIENKTNVLILVPTRELAVQVSEAFSNISAFLKLNVVTVYGGVDIRPQITKLKTANVIVATPGRLLDHIQRKTLNLTEVNTLVLDEADQMFDMGFVNDIEKIIAHLPKKRQTLLFSATFSPKINSLIKKHLINPIFIKAQEFVDESKLTQVYYNVSMERRFSLLAHLLKNDDKDMSIVFCNKRYEVDKVKNNLKKQGVKGVAIHGGLTQSKRQQALQLLKKEHANVLVATDVAARGLDISGVSHVYNFGIPKNSEEYTHRIGRTARMGRKGKAVSIVTERDRKEFTQILKDHKILREETPEFENIKFEKNLPNDDFRDSREGGFRGRRSFGERSERRGPRSFGPRNDSREERRSPRSFGEKSERRGLRRSFGERRSPRSFDGEKTDSSRSFGRRDDRKRPRNTFSETENSGEKRGFNRLNRDFSNKTRSGNDFARRPKFSNNASGRRRDLNQSDSFLEESKGFSKNRNFPRDEFKPRSSSQSRPRSNSQNRTKPKSAFSDLSKNKTHFSAKKDFYKKVKQFKKTNYKKD